MPHYELIRANESQNINHQLKAVKMGISKREEV